MLRANVEGQRGRWALSGELCHGFCLWAVLAGKIVLKTKELAVQLGLEKLRRICASHLVSMGCGQFSGLVRPGKRAFGGGPEISSDLPLQIVERMGDTDGRGALPTPIRRGLRRNLSSLPRQGCLLSFGALPTPIRRGLRRTSLRSSSRRTSRRSAPYPDQKGIETRRLPRWQGTRMNPRSAPYPDQKGIENGWRFQAPMYFLMGALPTPIRRGLRPRHPAITANHDNAGALPTPIRRGLRRFLPADKPRSSKRGALPTPIRRGLRPYAAIGGSLIPFLERSLPRSEGD